MKTGITKCKKIIIILIVINLLLMSIQPIFAMDDGERYLKKMLPKSYSSLPKDPEFDSLMKDISHLEFAQNIVSFNIAASKYFVTQNYDSIELVYDAFTTVEAEAVNHLEIKNLHEEIVFNFLNAMVLKGYQGGEVTKSEFLEFLYAIRGLGPNKTMAVAARYLVALMDAHVKESVLELENLLVELELDQNEPSSGNSDAPANPENPPVNPPENPSQEKSEINIVEYDVEPMIDNCMLNIDSELEKAMNFDKIDRESFMKDTEMVESFTKKLDELEIRINNAKTIEEVKKLKDELFAFIDTIIEKHPYKTKIDGNLKVPFPDEPIIPIDPKKDPDYKEPNLPYTETYGSIDKPGDVRTTKTISEVEGYTNKYKVDYKVEVNKSNRKDIVLVIDISPSMVNPKLGENDRIGKTKKYAKKLVEDLFDKEDPELYVSLITFDYTGHTKSKPLNYLNKEKLINNIHKIEIETDPFLTIGGTNPMAGLKKAYKELKGRNSNADFILLTDGEPNYGKYIKDPEELLKSHPEKFTAYVNSYGKTEYMVNENIAWEDFSDSSETSGSTVTSFPTIYYSRVDINKNMVFENKDEVEYIKYYYETLAIAKYIKEQGITLHGISLETTPITSNFVKEIASPNKFYNIDDGDKLGEAFKNIASDISKEIQYPKLVEKLNPSYSLSEPRFNATFSEGKVDVNGKTNEILWTIDDLEHIDPENPDIMYGEFSYIIEGNKDLIEAGKDNYYVPFYESSQLVSQKGGEVLKEFDTTPIHPTTISFTTLFYDEHGNPYDGKNLPVTISSENRSAEYRMFDGKTKLINLNGSEFSIKGDIEFHDVKFIWRTMDGKQSGEIQGNGTTFSLPKDADGNVINSYIYMISTRKQPIFEGHNLNDPEREGYIRYIFKSDETLDSKRGKLYSRYRKTDLVDNKQEKAPQDIIYYDLLEGLDFSYLVEPEIKALGESVVGSVRWDKEFLDKAEKPEIFIAQYNMNSSPDAKYSINYSFTSMDNQYSKLPEKVKKLLPVDQTLYQVGQKVKLSYPRLTTVQTREGKWVFKGWYSETTENPITDLDTAMVKGGLNVIGKWEFILGNKDTIHSPSHKDEYSTLSKSKRDRNKNQTINTTDKSENPNNTKIHLAYIEGYPDGTFKPEGTITRAEAAAMFARLKNWDVGDMTKPNFNDTDDWYNGVVNAAVKNGLMIGYPDGSFKPNGNITRAEMIQMMARMDKGNDKKSKFIDINISWAEDAIHQVYGNGRLDWIKENEFKPNQPITRAESVVSLNSLFDRKSTENSWENVENKDKLLGFKDVPKDHWAYLDIMSAAYSYEYLDTDDGEVWTNILGTLVK